LVGREDIKMPDELILAATASGNMQPLPPKLILKRKSLYWSLCDEFFKRLEQ